MVELPAQLIEIFQAHAPLAVAYSGGIDSRFLLHAAKLAQVEVLALHCTGCHIPEEETAFARAWALKQDIPLLLVPVNVLELTPVKHNAPDRCYHCKKHMLNQLASTLKAHNYQSYTLCDGSNLDDQKSYRPGAKALAEAKILSPLQKAGLTKANIRDLAKKTKLSSPNQKSSACLLTRFAYNTEITPQALDSIAALEERIRDFFKESKEKIDFRLRFTPAPVLQCSKMPKDRPALRELLSDYGLEDVALAITRKVSGFFDQNPSTSDFPKL